eukprot:gene3736-6624_t
MKNDEDWHFRIGEKYLGKKHYLNPIYLNKDIEIKSNENYKKNLKELSELVIELYLTKNEKEKELIIEKSNKIINKQTFPKNLNQIIDIRKKRKIIEKEIEKLKEKKSILELNFELNNDFISIINKNLKENKKSNFDKLIENKVKQIELKIKKIEKENIEIINLCNHLEDEFEGYISFIHQIELLNFYSINY